MIGGEHLTEKDCPARAPGVAAVVACALNVGIDSVLSARGARGEPVIAPVRTRFGSVVLRTGYGVHLLLL